MKKDRIVNAAFLLFIGMFIFLLYFYIMTRYKSQNYSFKYDFLFIREDKFMDFFNVNYFVYDRMPYDKASSYPPLALLISYAFTFFNRHLYNVGPLHVSQTISGLLDFIIFFGVGTCAVFLLIYMKINKSYVKEKATFKKVLLTTTAIVFTAPFIFLLDRGNYLIVSLILIILFMFNYNKNNTLASIFVAIAAALKLYPVVFFGIFLFDKKYKELIIGVICFIILLILPFVIFKGGFYHNFNLFLKNLFAFSSGSSAIGTIASNWFSVSLKTILLIPSIGFSKLTPFYSPNQGVIESASLAREVNIIYYIITLILFICSLIIVIKEKELWKRMLILTVFMILIPNNSYDYNLTYLLPSFVLFLTTEKQIKFEKVYLTFYVLLLIPKAYHYFNNSIIGLQSLIDPFVLLLIILFSMYDYYMSRKILKINL